MTMYPHPAYYHPDPRTKEMIPFYMPPNTLYQPWPYVYPVPHACCNHGGGPYGFHYPPPPFHPHGFYSPFPPQPYSVELPRYDYDKDKSNHHCCGCNHRERPEEPQVDKKTSDSSLLIDQPDYPIIRVPRGYTDSKANDDPEPIKRVGNGVPFQIYWLPPKNDEAGKDAKVNNLDLVVNKDEKTTKKDDSSGGSKHDVQNVIPVKQAVVNKDEKTTKKDDSLGFSKHAVQKVIPVKQADEKKVENGSRASPKTSKLPPVCLRIDPLPKKKRSPSPSEKERSSPRSSQQQPQRSEDEQSEAVKQDNLVGIEKEKVEEKKKLSEEEAAVVIQSAYRGYEVRKSEPLKKLRQIYQVQKQVFELRNHIQDLESFSRGDGKKEVIIGETIMSLLLKLDTIQGLHPFVREVRKSVAKELVGLQEKLDSLKSETATMCSPQPPAIQAQAQSENHEHKATTEADNIPNLEQQSEKSTEVDHAPTEYESDDALRLCEVEATESERSCGALQLELHKGKLDQETEAVGLHEVEVTGSQGEPQLEPRKELLDHECDSTNEVEVTGSQGEPQLEPRKELLDRECDSTNEVEVTGSQGEPQLEPHKELLDRECDGTNEVEVTGSQGEPQLEPHKELLDRECDNTNEAPGLCKAEEVEDTKPQTSCNAIGEPELESRKEEFDHECNNANEGQEVGAKDCLVIREINNKRLEIPTDDSSIQDLVHAESGNDAVIAEAIGCEVENAESCNVQKDVDMVEMKCDELSKDEADDLVPKAEKGVGHGGKLMEELMNQRIRELTGRVKDLEKKLAKKKKIKVNKCRRRSRACVAQKGS